MALSYIENYDATRIEHSLDDIIKTSMLNVKRSGIPYDKGVDARCGKILGFNRVNLRDHGPDCLYFKDGTTLFFENKRNDIPVAHVMLEDTGEEKARAFAERDDIYISSSAFAPIDDASRKLLLDKVKSRNIRSKVGEKEYKEFIGFLEYCFFLTDEADPLFFVFGKSNMIPPKKTCGELVSLEEASRRKGDKRRNISYTYNSLLSHGFIVICKEEYLRYIKTYFKIFHKKMMPVLKMVSLEDFQKRAEKGQFDYYFSSQKEICEKLNSLGGKYKAYAEYKVAK